MTLSTVTVCGVTMRLMSDYAICREEGSEKADRICPGNTSLRQFEDEFAK